MARYATVAADLPRLGLSSRALEGVPLATQEAALEAACGRVDGYLRGRFSLPLVWVVLGLARRTAGITGPAVDTYSAGRVRLALDVSELDDGAAVTVALEHSADGSAWVALGSFGTFSAPAHEVLDFPSGVRRYVRAVVSLSGGGATAGVSFDGDDLKRAVCVLASADLLRVRGYDPESADKGLMEAAKEVLAWLRELSAGKVSPDWIDISPLEEDGGPLVASRRPRGWV